MPNIAFETAIADFLALGRRLQAAQSLTGQRVLEELTAWYRDARVEGASLDEDADMLLLQWGATRPLIVAEPTDLRELGDDDLQFSDEEVQYLDFSRQVFAKGADEDEEFDDAAVQMSITLGFAAADGSEPDSNQWIGTPDDVESGTGEFLAQQFVQSLISVPARAVAITVGHCGEWHNQTWVARPQGGSRSDRMTHTQRPTGATRNPVLKLVPASHPGGRS